jgi:hypothetical protein
MSHLSPEGNALLTADFNEKEVFKASCQMKHNKDPILDGIQLRFIKEFGK